MSAVHEATLPAAGWRQLLAGRRGARVGLLCAGVGLHAINLYLAATLLPSVVRDIGGLALYAWNTSLFVLGSVVGSAVAGWAARRFGGRRAYMAGALVFAAGSALCAGSPTMAGLVAARLVQGLGGGLLLALPYAFMQRLFEPAWWPRATALVSGTWGVATLFGPAVGGALAEAGRWREGFALLVPAGLLLAVAAWRLLPADRPDEARAGVAPMGQLARLGVAVLGASAAGNAQGVVAPLMFTAVALGSLVWMWRHERDAGASGRLLPRGAVGPTRLRTQFLAMALLAVTVTCSEGFVPLFLQQLHGVPPLAAGLMAATLSAGWTVGAVLASGASGPRVQSLLAWAPRMSLAGMLGVAALLPGGSGAPAALLLVLLTLAMVAVGMAVGMAWPHLAAQTMAQAPADEAELAGASVMTVQLIATALAAAVAGMVLNAAGLAEGRADVAATWLFGLSALGPLALVLRGAVARGAGRGQGGAQG